MKFIFIKPEQFAYTFKIHIMQSPEIYLDFVEREKVDDENFARSIPKKKIVSFFLNV